MSTIIVTGASGFIGSQLVQDLLESYDIIGIDIESPNSEILQNPRYRHLRLDLTDTDTYNLIPTENIKCICHLAAKIRVDESQSDPQLYYQNNVVATLNLLKWALHNNIKNFLFASTAAVYGNPSNNSFVEEDAGNPASVYGRGKLMVEQILADYSVAYGLRGYIFRFFNVCGGAESNHPKAIHLIPIIANNLIESKDIKILGTDYKTKDGTCVRDYIHYKDITRGFVMAINCGFSHTNFKTYNLGSGSGYSVREIVTKSVEWYTQNIGIPSSSIVEASRRPG